MDSYIRDYSSALYSLACLKGMPLILITP